ncbi:Sodium- and chloride-dependent glycine transporter 1, partial [Armadillidium nasatum]
DESPKPRKEDERDVWGSKIEFILSCLSFAVGLGNIWRFPYLCYRNGGGWLIESAFLIPYVCMLAITGLPLYFFELCLGQYGREGPITIWKVVPLFQGLGYGMFMIAFFIALYYNAVYFTALFPYAVLVILFVRAVTLPGYVNGITFYLTPEWGKLANAKVWGDAAMQIFFSLGPCWGGLITLGSYNKFNNNCLRDAIIVSCANCLTSFFAGFVIFGIVGFMAHELGVSVKDVAAQGAGLAFIAYPEAVARLPISPFWAILFFVMLLTLGVGSQFTIVQTVITSIIDVFNLRHRSKEVTAAVCTVSCLIGLTMCTRHGMYILQLLDNYAGTYSALMIGCI